jgi:all-trans-8'-apo-beta-carotenal 15,15'-oxygenase
LAGLTQPAVSLDVWDAGRRRLVCEPLFVPKAGEAAEDEGWVLAVLHNAETMLAELVVLNAQDIAGGPLATIRLPHHLAPGLHGSFTPQVLLQDWDALAPDAWQHPNTSVRAI